MIKVDDIFGYWKVISFQGKTPLCLCTLCNKTIRPITPHRLKKTKKCKDCSKSKNPIVEGELYGHWKALRKDKSQRYHTIVTCTGCNNQKEHSVRNSALKRKTSTSCGCQNKAKIDKTMQEKYGGWSQASQKRKETNLEKYGVEYSSKRAEHGALIRATSLEKYGVEHYSQTEEFIKRSISTKEKNGIIKVLSNGMTLKSYLKTLESAPNYSNAKKILNNLGEEATLHYVDKLYKEQIYTTEIYFIDLMKNYLKVEKYDKSPLEFSSSRRPDFRIEQNNKILYINCDGFFPHTKEGFEILSRNARTLKNDYHLTLAQEFRSAGVELFQFREDELREKPEIVASIVCNYLNIYTNRIYGRKCSIQKVSPTTTHEFLESNHLMGGVRTWSYGLFYQDELVALMSVKKIKSGIDISRFCTKRFTSVAGGFSKILKHIVKLYEPDFIQSFVDLRYATGSSLQQQGFILKSTSLGWKWTDNINSFNRLQCRANMDSRGFTQQQHAEELGWCKIYDAGQAKYHKQL